MSQPGMSAEIDENTEVPENTKLSEFEEIYSLLDKYNWDIRRNFHRAAEAEEGRRRLIRNHYVSNSTPAMLWTAAVGRDALVENGDWLAMLRCRDLKIDQESRS